MAVARGLGTVLGELAGRADPRRLANDPLGLVRDARDREGAALLGALLAFGHVRGIRRSVATAIRALDGDARALDGFRHRWIGEAEIRALLAGLAAARARCGSLEQAFLEHDDGDLGRALDGFATALRGPRPTRGLRFLLPRPADGSACKRWALFLRWVARPDDGVDLGLWRGVAPARLVVPLDTHVYRIAYWLGLTDRRTTSWRTALDVTRSLQRFDPDDPVRFDFALAHLGILADCPRRPVRTRCAPCPLRPWCRAWRTAGAATTRSRASRPPGAPTPPPPCGCRTSRPARAG